MAAQQHNWKRRERYSIWPVYGVILALTLAAAPLSGTGAYAQETSKKPKGRELKKDGITAYIVRDEERNTIKLTMLIGQNSTLTQRIRKMVGREVLPLIFSVSTVPGHSYYFNPLFLEFEQGGRTWRPDSSSLDSVIIILEENGKFGGLIHGGETHQAVVLLPEWFKADEPIFVRYVEDGRMGLRFTEASGSY